jgi:hypothetical protein
MQNLHAKSTIQVESEQWTVHSPHQTQLENTLGEHIGNQGNPLGTWREHVGWEQRKNEKKKISLPLKNPCPLNLPFFLINK